MPFAFSFLLLLPTHANAWGAAGHRIIATVASRRLTPAARSQVKALLASGSSGKTLAAVSVWADEVRRGDRPETERWHYVDIPVSSTSYDPGRDCRLIAGKGDCAIAATTRQIAVLADRGRSDQERRDALKFVTHLVGDLHQPLHCAERDVDRGGNLVPVTFFDRKSAEFGEPWNLHAVWDTGLIMHALEPRQRLASYVAQYARRLDAWLASRDVARLQAGGPVEWALECHHTAIDAAYAGVSTRGASLGRDYYERSLPIVDGQLARGGVRLAKVLNETLR